MAHRSQCSSAGDNPLDPNYLPPHYREDYRMAIDMLVDADLEGYYGFLQGADVVDFLSRPEIDYIKSMVHAPHHAAQPERTYMAEDADGSSDTYWPVHSDLDAPSLDLGWPQQYRFVGPTEVTILVNPSDPEMPSIKEQVRRMIKNAQQVIAVVMDMFTDVDIFADILGAAMRGVAVYILLDELNAHYFIAMVNNCRVNLDDVKFMRVRTVSGSTYLCRTGKSFKGQMMDRFIMVDCRAVLSGNYSFMWSFEKIHRCLAHLFLGQLVTSFDEEFRILFAQSEPLVVDKILANIPNYSNVHGSYYNTDKSQMFKREYPTIDTEWSERSAEDRMHFGHKMLPFRRGDSIHSAVENPSAQRHMNWHATQQFRGDHQFPEHARQMRGPGENFKRRGYAEVPNYEYMPQQKYAPNRGKHNMEEAMTQGSHFPNEPCLYPPTGLQPGYETYGRFRGQGYNLDQFSGSGYPHEESEAEPLDTYDHVQRYLQSHSAMEEGHDAGNLFVPVQSNLKRHSMGQPYACQTSPTQPNLPDQKRFFGASRKPQDVSQKQGLRDWRISSYLSACDDPGEVDLPELEGTDPFDNVPHFMQTGPSSRKSHTFAQLQNNSNLPDNLINHPADLSQVNIKTTPATTSESSCTTEGDKMEETQNREPKETNLISEEFLRKKPTRTVQRSSRLRHSLIFNSNLELHPSEEVKDTSGEKDGGETSKLSTLTSHIKRAGPRELFQWSNYARAASSDNQTTESANPEDVPNKMGENVHNVEISQNFQKASIKDPLQEKHPPTILQSAVSFQEINQKDEYPSTIWQRSASFIDMNDPDCRLRYFKELAAKRKAELAAAKDSQSNPVKSSKTSDELEKHSTKDPNKMAGSALKPPETLVTVTAPETHTPYSAVGPKAEQSLLCPENDAKPKLPVSNVKQQTFYDISAEEPSKDIPHRATDAEKIRFKKKLAEESGSTLKMVGGTNTVSKAKNQSTSLLSISIEKPTLSGESSNPVTSLPPKTYSRDFESLSDPATFEVSSSQNLVDSVASNTSSTETGLNHNQISKETGLNAECCPLVDLQEIKCTSPLSITPNECCLSSDDSQTLVQSSPQTFDSCPTTVAVSSTPNLDTVNSGLSSKPSNMNIGPMSMTGTSSSQHPTVTAPDSASSQQPTATGVNTSQQLTVMVPDSSQHPTETENECYQKPAAKKTDSFQMPTAKEDSSQYPTATETNSCLRPIATEVNSFQQPSAVGSDSSQKPIAMKVDISKHPIATESESLQHLTGTETDCVSASPSTESSFKIASSSQTVSFCDTIPAENQILLHMDSLTTNISGTNSDLNLSPEEESTEVDSTQLPSETESESSKNSTPIGMNSNSFQQLTATEADPLINSSQQPSEMGADISQQPTAAESESTECPTVTGMDSSQQLTAAKGDSFQKPSEMGADNLENPTAVVSESSQQPTAIGADPTATGNEPPIATGIDSSQQLTDTEADSSKHPPGMIADSSQQPNAMVAGSSQQSTETGAGSSQNPTEMSVDTSKHPIATESESFQQITDSECVSASPSIESPFRVTLSSQTVSFSDTVPADSQILLHNGSVSTNTSVTNSNLNLPVTCTSEVNSPEHGPADSESSIMTISHCDTTTPEISLSEETILPDIKKKAENNFTQTEISLSQSTVMTDSSTDEHLSDISTPCASQQHSSNLNSNTAKPSPQSDDKQMGPSSSMNQTQAFASLITVIEDTSSGALTSPHSVEVSSAQPHDLPEPCLSSNLQSTTQGTTQLHSNTSSEPVLETSCIDEPKPENNKDESQNHMTTEEQPQRDDTSAIAETAEVSEDTIQKTMPELENSVTNFAEASEKSEGDLASHTDIESQSSVPESPKPNMSSHLSSTANVLSFSNLRDDTKALLEQISAKNQSRASQSKQTLPATDEDKEIAVSRNGSADKQTSGHLGNKWSSKTTPEEREMLLKKMEKMRKERKVYSRFEAS